MFILQTILIPLLIPLAWIYGIVIWVRNSLYNFGLFRVTSFDIPIISVGNITLGGTGKTPMVIYLAKFLFSHGRTPGIVSRGYGRDSKGIIMVHDGKEILTDVNSAGDEPYLIGTTLNNTPVVVSVNRKLGIQKLLDQTAVDVIILDDAFQHRKVKRDIDIVTVSSDDGGNDYHLLPWGKLREPLKNLIRSDFVIYTRTNQHNNPPIHNTLKPYIKNLSINSVMQLVLMKKDKTGYHKSMPEIEQVFAFCGIGNPDCFFNNVRKIGLQIGGSRIFQDHQKYNLKILEDLSFQVHSRNCRAVVTTEKDMMKLPESFIKKFDFYVIKINVVFKNDSVVMNLIKHVLLPSI